jgi:glycosyltransferase involved in cell wall biosynthesis
MNGKVSIIIPVYNGSKYIIETLISCARQTHRDLEVLIINDCSTDDSKNLIEEFIITDERFQLIDNNDNLGIVKNVNKGIDLSTGEFIITLGHDDILLPDHILIMLQEIQTEDSLIYCNADLIDGCGQIIGIQISEQHNLRNIAELKYRFMLGNTINSCGLMFRKSSAMKVGKWTVLPEFPHYGEWLFWIKLLTVGKIRYTNKIRSQYRRHETNITNTFVNKKTQVKLFKFYLICMKFAYEKFSHEIAFEQKIKAKIVYLKLLLKQKFLEVRV